MISVLALGLLAAPIAAEAQQPAKVPRIGLLTPGSPGDPFIEAFRQGLRALGYVEGQNIALEYRWAESKYDRLPGLASDLVRLNVDLIFARSTPGARAAKNATTAIPIVFAAVTDPVNLGIVDSLARPWGNITGLTHIGVDLVGKDFELLREAVPGMGRVAVLANPANPAHVLKLGAAQDAARFLGAKLKVLEVRSSNDFAAAFSAIRREQPDALVTFVNPLTLAHRKLIVDFAAKSRLPAVYEVKEFVEAGGLMSYGTSFPDMYRRAATYVDKILKGAKPADLPVEQPTRFELVLNMKTAKALGITFPPTIMVRADQVIQ